MKNVRVLNGKNYNIWKYQMTQVFIQLDLVDIIKGTNTRPAYSQTDNSAQKAWDKLNAKALITLTSTMDDEQHDMVSNCYTAKEM